jgi:hypothetical protein
MRGHIEPHWSRDQLISINYESQENIQRGFSPIDYGDVYSQVEVSMNIHKGLHPLFDTVKLEKCFNWLAAKMYAVHCMKPGCALPEHSDKYPYYIKTNNIADINSIQRVIVFLENKKPGHRFTLNGVELEDWVAGDWISWVGAEIHGAYNEGTETRYTLQITGIIRGLNPT